MQKKSGLPRLSSWDLNAQFEWSSQQAYEHYYDGTKLLENLIFALDIPTIGVINGGGPRKEIALACDITLWSDDIAFADGNFVMGGSAPGDSMIR